MPRFKITRRKPQSEAPEQVEKKPEQETPLTADAQMDDARSESSEALTEYMEKLDVAPQVQKPQTQPQRPARMAPQKYAPARVAPQPTRNARFAPQRYQQPRMPDPVYRKPATLYTRRAGLRGSDRRQPRFRSHYGPNGDALDTHTKARLLYNHCFA